MFMGLGAFGVIMLLCALSVALLRSALLAANDRDAPIARAAARGHKGAITIGAYVVAAWLLLIIVNLLILGQYFDVALRDFGLMVGAIALARLAQGVHDWKARS